MTLLHLFLMPLLLVSFFFLITPPPPRSTLFPYTTLFRSKRSRTLSCEDSAAFWHIPRAQEASYSAPLPSVRDRKSTRLNSSHEWISYAVFCLKKKKKTL